MLHRRASWRWVVLLAVVVGLSVGAGYASAQPGGPSDVWYTYLGTEPATAGDGDVGHDIAPGPGGSVIVVGETTGGDWGVGAAAVGAYGGSSDGFATKPDAAGAVDWYTFLGGVEGDGAAGVAPISDGGFVVAGDAIGSSWGGTPISGVHGSKDIFVAKLEADGARSWFTFVGTAMQEACEAVAADDGGIYVTGSTNAGVNIYVAKLSTTGTLRWQRVITSTLGDLGAGRAIAVDAAGHVIVVGDGVGNWAGLGAPVNANAGSRDGFVAKLNGESGDVLWHTFVGSASADDAAYGVALSGTPVGAEITVVGRSADWGTPVAPFNGTSDAFVARLSGNDGGLQWHTFMGSINGAEAGRDVAIDGDGRVVVTGESAQYPWGRPTIAHPGGLAGMAAYVAVLDADGHFLGNAFAGSVDSSDYGLGLVVSPAGRITFIGGSHSPNETDWRDTAWGVAQRPIRGKNDAFVAAISVTDVARYTIYLPLAIR